MKIYAGAPAAARHYVEADRGRVDDYYLAEGTGIARRYYAGPDGSVSELAPLAGDGYEAWVAGLDPQTGVPRGQLRADERAVRFVEVVVNGPKSWSLAAALHPDIAVAYDAAQESAASQIIGWLAEHATTRVGPRGGQVQVPAEALEAVTVAHHTSRAGDPHRHLHLQVNARVFAAGKWRGLHTVGVRDSLAAINGIGHAAVTTDPQFRAALAAHGYVLNTDGEIRQLADFVGAFGARAAQIARNVDRYEREWAAAHPGEHAGPALRRAWDARAWADGRPDKVRPQPGANLDERWRTELVALGYRDRDIPVALTYAPVGVLDRGGAVERVLARLAAARSAWNAADIRGEVEQLLAAAGIVTDPSVRLELAEDLTARALARCVPLMNRDGLPEHIRAWTSRPVLDVEADVTARLINRATAGTALTDPTVPAARQRDGDPTVVPDTDPTPPAQPTVQVGWLDAGQAAAAIVLSDDRRLVVIEGAAGAGKTTTLSATRALLATRGHRLVVVTPTLKAAKVAAVEVGTSAGSAAWLAHQHGWRWTDDGTWTRLAVGDVDPVTGCPYTGPTEGALLRQGDLLVVDETGMLDQDTARALLTVADEARVRVALLGDRHQLAAVGRGGVLDLAARAVDPTAHLTLAGVHRFTRADGSGDTVPDSEYADLTLAMRAGKDPGAVFDALAARGQIRLHPDRPTAHQALAATAAASYGNGGGVAVVVDTREQADQLSAAIRDYQVAGGRVDDALVAVTGAGQRIGVGDRIATRRNDRTLGVANRDVWLVTAVGRRGELVVTPAENAPGDVTPDGVGPAGPAPAAVTPAGAGNRVLPAGYVTKYVELAYTCTAHGVQGDTVTAAHTVIGEHTGAASAYVGMTRGRQTNTARLVAADLGEAREQWITVFARDRADLGPAHAAQLAATEVARYADGRPLGQVLADLRAAWTDEQDCLNRLAVWQPRQDTLRVLVALDDGHADRLASLEAGYRQAAIAAEQARDRAQASAATVAAETDRGRDALLATWDGQWDAARAAARVVLDGPGRLRFRRPAVANAGQLLTDWADRWRPHLGALPTDPQDIASVAGGFDHRPALWAALSASARHAAEAAHPEHTAARAAADNAQEACDQARHALVDARRQCDERLARFGAAAGTRDSAGRLAEVQHDLAAAQQELADVRARIATLTAEPALRVQPGERMARERAAWAAHCRAEEATRSSASQASSPPATRSVRPPEPPVRLTRGRGVGPSFGR